MGLCAARWTYFMCHHELWPISAPSLLYWHWYTRWICPYLWACLPQFCIKDRFTYSGLSMLFILTFLWLGYYCVVWLYLTPPPPSSATYMRQGTEPALSQVMACRLFGAKPLPEPMLTCCQLDHKEQTSVKFESKSKISSFMKMHLKTSSVKWRPFLSWERWVNSRELVKC